MQFLYRPFHSIVNHGLRTIVRNTSRPSGIHNINNHIGEGERYVLFANNKPRTNNYNHHVITQKTPLSANSNAQGSSINAHKLNCQRFYSNRPLHVRKFPDLLYFPHIFRWLGNKMKFKYLQNTWDPEFSEGAFIYGSTRAICRITEIINEDRPDQLKGLLTTMAEEKLKLDMEIKLSPLQKEVIKIDQDDIKLLVPMKVQLVNNKSDQKYCAVLLKSLSMKWYEDKNTVKLALIVIETEFRRNYQEEAPAEWIISLFNVVQCMLVGGATPNMHNSSNNK